MMILYLLWSRFPRCPEKYIPEVDTLSELIKTNVNLFR